MDSVDMSYLYNTNNNSISLVVSAVASAAVAAATNNNNNNESIDDTSTNLSRRLPYVWVDSSASLSSSSSTLDDCARIDASNHRRIENLLRASNMLLMVYPWVLMCTGTITNAISFAVLTRPKLKKSSTFFYLACLCVIDLLSLYTFCINFIFFYHFKIDIQLQHVIICKIFSFLTYFLPQLSAWTCAAVSLDRVVGVFFSVHGKYAAAAKRWNTPSKARQVMCVIFFFIFALNFHFLFYPNEYQMEGDDVRIKDINLIYCSPENIPRFQNFYNVWVHIDLSMNVLIPFLIMIASSIIIVSRIIKSTQNLGQLKNGTFSRCSSTSTVNMNPGRSKSVASNTNNNSKKSNNNAANNPNRKSSVTICTPISTNPIISTAKRLSATATIGQVRFNNAGGAGSSMAETDESVTVVHNQNSPTDFEPPVSPSSPFLQVPRQSVLLTKRRSSTASSNATSKAKSVSYMLAANNFVFISLTLPIVVFLSIAPPFSLPGLCDIKKAKLRLIKVICIILMNSNCSINIFIYSFMSSEFRYQLIMLAKNFCIFLGWKSASSAAAAAAALAVVDEQRMERLASTASRNIKKVSKNLSSDCQQDRDSQIHLQPHNNTNTTTTSTNNINTTNNCNGQNNSNLLQLPPPSKKASSSR